MASHICLRCLVRPSVSSFISLSSISSPASIASFSTTSAVASSVGKKIPKKKPAAAKTKTGGFTLARRGARSPATSAARKDPAAIRAQRKRIVLSNPNALLVPGLQELTIENVLSSKPGTILTLSNESIDALRAAEAFKHTQGWNLFRQPSTLVTEQTREVAELINGIEQEGETNRNVYREVVVGEKGAGKSVVALQTMAIALQQGWVVIHIPEDLSQGQTTYIPTRSSSGSTLYTQPDYTASLLARISNANEPVLSTLTLSKSHSFPIPIQPNISLSRLCDLGSSDPSIAPSIFTALLSELTSPSSESHPRPPLLFSVDSIPHILRPSAYLDREARPIHAFDLALVDTFVSLLSGKTSLPNGGIVQAVDTGSNRPPAAALDAHVRGKEATRALAPFMTPYSPPDERVLAALKGVAVRTVSGVSRIEARGVMEYYARSGVMRGVVDETRVGEAWTLAGGGVMAELEASLTRLRV
ncbi:hypothetical protein K461DRAFT_35359 [Myriangium duriaei CBS 260.36]|uniref:Small ribosomal subunit protein mS29 n=1 Tax=Myriangium duriaei CBS 260.36 TaxID=1168546 RepID=A0A9P4IY58_9PEZI|nr:hypothetical protein K461DRAFT_35359 [Myriangium duriaei CBS 260.36]